MTDLVLLRQPPWVGTERRGSHNGCGCPYPCWSYGWACPAVNELRRACIASASVTIGLINNWVLLK